MVQEAGEQSLAVLGVGDLGVELHAEPARDGVLHDGDRHGARRRGDREACGGLGHRDPVAHPDRGALGPLLEDRRRARAVQVRATVLAESPVSTVAAEVQREQLRAVADAQDRDPEVVDARVDPRCTLLVDAPGPPEKMIAAGCVAATCSAEIVCDDDLGVDVRLADPPGDELRVLRAEVDDEDGWCAGQCPMPTPWARWSCLPSVCSEGAIMTSAFWNSLSVS